MALKFYGGTPGAGKSYEVVENVILPGLRAGRRIVTNIAGLQYEAMVEYLCERGADEAKLGTIHKIELTEETAGKLGIIRGDGEDAKLDSASIVQGGDIVVLDEIWRIWEDGKRMHADDVKFLRMHRHVLNPTTHVSCDVVIIAQDYGDVHRSVRRLVEERYVMTKHIALGMSKRYRVSVFAKGSRKAHVQYQKKYDPKVFALYKSHSMGTGDGVEKSVDSRGNILKGAMFTIVLPLALIVGGAGIWGVYHFLNPKQPEAKQSLQLAGAPRPGVVGPASPAAAPKPDPASEWRVYGQYMLGATRVVVIQSNDGRTRHITNPADLSVGINDLKINVDGKPVSYYSAAGAAARPVALRP
jgi:zona occludens toxin